jgi:hypothetical protein
MGDKILKLQNADWVNLQVRRKQDEEATKLKNEFFDRIKEQFFHLWD